MHEYQGTVQWLVTNAPTHTHMQVVTAAKMSKRPVTPGRRPGLPSALPSAGTAAVHLAFCFPPMLSVLKLHAHGTLVLSHGPPLDFTGNLMMAHIGSAPYTSSFRQPLSSQSSLRLGQPSMCPVPLLR